MADPVRLQLYVGPAVPIPAPREVIEAVVEVKVDAHSGGLQSGFEITFSLSNQSPLQTLFLLSGGAVLPIVRVVIAVTVRGSTTILVDGVMTHHEVSSNSGPSSTLTIRGKDLTALMDIIPLDGLPYPVMPPSLRALAVLAKYAAIGVVPMVIPMVIEDIPIPIERIPRHQGTDYQYLKALAEEAGYVFCIEPGPAVGTSVGYWGPEIRLGAPQHALNLSLDGPHNNVETLSFTFDKERKEIPVVFIQESVSKAPIPIPIPDITPLSPPLGVVPPLPPKITFLRDTAKLSPLGAAMRGLAYSGQHADSVFGTGTLDVARYGSVLQARRLVGVRGAGMAFDGLHYVTSVSSSLKRGSFTQSFTLARNGLLSTIPAVPA